MRRHTRRIVAPALPSRRAAGRGGAHLDVIEGGHALEHEDRRVGIVGPTRVYPAHDTFTSDSTRHIAGV